MKCSSFGAGDMAERVRALSAVLAFLMGIGSTLLILLPIQFFVNVPGKAAKLV